MLFIKANINQFKLIEIPSPLCAVSLPHSGWPPLGGGRPPGSSLRFLEKVQTTSWYSSEVSGISQT